jgi:UDP:flavonoid glycosyltransferase YjiC (YdhE family)
MYDPATVKRNEVPANIQKQVYDRNDDVLFGSAMVKGKVMYNYIPGELMTTGRPFIVSVAISYDGVGNKDLPKDAIIMNFVDLPNMFPDNQFT